MKDRRDVVGAGGQHGLLGFAGQGGDLLGSENNTAAATYVLNTNSMKFHHANCRYASRISPENYRTCSSREEAIAQGFIPCGVCNP